MRNEGAGMKYPGAFFIMPPHASAAPARSEIAPD